jgi:hypothetical protein
MNGYTSKIHISLLMLLAVLASSAALVATASATTLSGEQWLFNGEAVKATLNTEIEIELLLEDTNASGVKAAAQCSMIQTGSVKPTGEGEAKEILNLAKEAISLTSLSGASLSCTNETNCASAKVWAVNLPWQVYLGVEEVLEKLSFTIADLSGSGGNPGWYVECTVIGIKVSDECTNAELESEAKNVAAGVETIFSTSQIEELQMPLATCSISKETTGVIEGKSTLKDAEAGTLSISTEEGGPAIEPSSNPVNFGTIASGTTLTLSITFINVGTLAWTPGRPRFQMGSATFLIVPGSNTCTGAIASLANCLIEIQFAPTIAHQNFEGEFFFGNLLTLMEGKTS